MDARMRPGAAVVLEGGGLRGVFTAGVLDVLTERGVDGFHSLWGVSAGALMGASYLSRQPGRAIRVNLAYRDDPRYMGVRQLARTGDVVSPDFLYRQVQDELDPFDYAAFNANPTRMFAVVSEMAYGTPEYVEIDRLPERTGYVRASASLPVLSRPVELDGRLYLDGGTTDSVPLERALEEPGCDRALVVLTRERGFVKRPSPLLPAARRMYAGYPYYLEAIETRPERYNAQRLRIWELEEAGRAFVIAPARPIEVGDIEHDGGRLLDLYMQGRRAAAEALDERGLGAFLGLEGPARP